MNSSESGLGERLGHIDSTEVPGRAMDVDEVAKVVDVELEEQRAK